MGSKRDLVRNSIIFDYSMTFLETAKQFAHDAHDSIDQVRKHGEAVPYWIHTDAVADKVDSVSGTLDMIAAAHLHDVIEDVMPLNAFWDLESIVRIFNSEVATLVIEVTNVFTHEAYPATNRAARNLNEHMRLACISDEGKVIKLADRWHNTTDLGSFKGGFRETYIRETREMIGMLHVSDSSVWFNKVQQLKLEIAANIAANLR